MATTRVYLLARELGVKSSAIVKKCKDEGLDVKNHMSTISAGLAATIKEWFSEGENVTTVETADKVDLERVRVARRRKKKAKEAESEAESDAEQVQVAIAEPETETQEQTAAEAAPEAPEAEQQVEETAETTETSETTEEGEQAGEMQTEQPVAPAAQEDTAAAATVEQPPEEEQGPEPEAEQEQEEPEPEPEPVVPAGPQLEKPEPAQLTGPEVVRVEAPEPPSYKPRGRGKGGNASAPLMGAAAESEFGGRKRRGGRKAKDRTHGRRKDLGDSGTKRGRPKGKWRERDIEERRARLSAAGGEGFRLRPTRKITSKSEREAAARARPSKITITAPITVKDLSAALAVKSADIIATLMKQGMMVTANQSISGEVAQLVALEFNVELTVETKAAAEDRIREEFESRERKNIEKRPVVAAMLGHVDHGKTSLLDKIRETQVAAGEAGGITQHIGASEITWNDKKVTFLDTPGHEAFTAMRARGANMTDVVVLVVAADDGVMPQTIEAIAHSKAADVSIIVALNKIDLPGVDINRIYAQLSEHGLTPAEWGGDTEVVKTSATTGEGIDDLLEALDYVAELMELKADSTIPATGWVIEARMSPQRGPVATILIAEGKLDKSDVLLAGNAYGRIKTLRNSFGKNIKTASSSMPVEVTGLSDVPQAGDRFYRLPDINSAKQAAEENEKRLREDSLHKRTQVTLDNLFSQIEEGKTQELKLIVKADVQGSVDVLVKYLAELSTEEIKISVLHSAVGGVTEGDVVLAEASNAIIIGFNVSCDEHVTKLAEEKGVDMRFYSVIYRITEDIREAMTGMLAPEEKEQVLGRAMVRTLFKVSRLGTIAGCYVSNGVVAKHGKVRLIRDNIVIRDEMNVESLKHFKDDVKEVKAGLECGIKIAGFDDFKIDDTLEFYEIIKVARTL